MDNNIEEQTLRHCLVAMETDGPFILPIRSCTFWTPSSSSLATEIVWHVTHWLPPLLCLQMFLRDCWHSTWPPLHSRGAPAPQPSKQMSHHHPHLLTLTNHPALQVGSSLSSPTDTLPVICMYLYSYRSGATREDINRQVNAINFRVFPRTDRGTFVDVDKLCTQHHVLH